MIGREAGGLPDDAAERAAEAVLRVLAARLLDRIAKREDTDIETAFAHAQAVFAALGQALSPETLTHLAAGLPRTFGPLVAEAQGRLRT